MVKAEQPIQLAQLLTKPAHSIINQASDSRLRLDAGSVPAAESLPSPPRSTVFTHLPLFNRLRQINQCRRIRRRVVPDRTRRRRRQSGTLRLPVHHAGLVKRKLAPSRRQDQESASVCACPRFHHGSPQRREHVRLPRTDASTLATFLTDRSLAVDSHPWTYGNLIWMHKYAQPASEHSIRSRGAKA